MILVAVLSACSSTSVPPRLDRVFEAFDQAGRSGTTVYLLVDGFVLLVGGAEHQDQTTRYQ